MPPFQTVLTPYLKAENVHALPAGLDKWGAIAWLGERACAAAGVERTDVVLAALRDRERMLTTGIGYGCAVPHVRHPDVLRETILVGRPERPLAFESVDGRPVRAVFLILMPISLHRRYIEILGAVAAALKPEWLRESVYDAPTPEAFVARLLADRAPSALAV